MLCKASVAVRPGAKGSAMAGKAAPGSEVEPGIQIIRWVCGDEVTFEAEKSVPRSG